MTTPEDFAEHFKLLAAADLKEVQALLDKIEKIENIGLAEKKEIESGIFEFPTFETPSQVDEFRTLVYKLGLVINFDWPAWQEGKEILNKPDFDVSQMDPLSLCKLLTIIIRKDRFVDGTLVACLKNGMIQKIITELRNKIERE